MKSWKPILATAAALVLALPALSNDDAAPGSSDAEAATAPDAAGTVAIEWGAEPAVAGPAAPAGTAETAGIAETVAAAEKVAPAATGEAPAGEGTGSATRALRDEPVAPDVEALHEVPDGVEAKADPDGLHGVVDAAAPTLADSAAATADGGGPAEAVPTVVSGAEGVDAHGHRGRIHVVVRGDTLWGISEQYLRTPWSWPSIWLENEDIANPHRIYPGDHIWVSATEMRRVTPDEAAEMVAAETNAEEVIADTAPAAAAGEVAATSLLDEPPAAMEDEAEPLAIAPAAAPAAAAETLTVSSINHVSFVSPKMLDAATSVVDSSLDRTYLGQGDELVIGLGEGDVEVGDHFSVFREARPVRDLRSSRVLGYHVERLGWVEVTSVEGDSATAVIRHSSSEIVRGDRLMPRQPLPPEVTLVAAPDDLDARVVFIPSERTFVGQLDYAYLDRGSVDGLEEGARVEVYAPGGVARDRARGVDVVTPDTVVADLVVIRVE